MFRFKNRILITAIASVLVWAQLAWQHFNGGVVSHYILHDKTMPSISNWCGAVAIPLFTWVLLYRMHKRNHKERTQHKHSWQNSLIRMVAGMLFGICLTVLFLNESVLLDYQVPGLFVLALFLPLFWGEYYLGFVFGATAAFGAIIPIVSGLVLSLIVYLIYKVPRLVIAQFNS